MHQELDRFSQDAAGDELRLHQREQESEGQQDACDDGHPAKGGVCRHRPARAREIDGREARRMPSGTQLRRSSRRALRAVAAALNREAGATINAAVATAIPIETVPNA